MRPSALRHLSSPLLALSLALTAVLPAASLPPLDPARVAEIARSLSASPVNFTPPVSDRAFWDALAASQAATAPDALAALHAAADRVAATPPPPLTEALYNTFRETGARKPYEQPYALRLQRLGLLLYSTALANTPALLPAIERDLAAILDEPTWAAPAHTEHRPDWHAAHDFIDLGAAARAASLATTDFLLADQLAPETRARLRREIRDRIFVPYLGRIRAADRRDFWWMSSGNNWNAVCNTGVLLSALLLPETAAESFSQVAPDDAVPRPATALFVAAWETFTRSYLAGFSDDGFCSEGIGYWNYGFGHYVLGSEWIRLATGGRLDLLDAPKQRLVATFPDRWKIAGETYPPFGDVALAARPRVWLHDFLVLRYGDPRELLSPRAASGPGMIQGDGLSALFCITSFDLGLARPATDRLQSGAAEPAIPVSTAGDAALRGWFPDGGALVVRRAPDPADGLATAFKGGHNAQPHNHNDLGSFIVLCDGQTVLTDPGSDTYVKDTFGPRRYTSDLMNSRGHPVPLVAGKLQRTGSNARAVTLRNEFTAARDLWEIDLTSAYVPDVPALEKLTRTFIFTRSAPDAPRGRVEIIDRINFRKGHPNTFGTALIFLPTQQREPLPASGLRVRARSGDARVDVTWRAEADACPVELVPTETPLTGIVPSQGAKGTRLGLDLPAPVTTATLHMTFLPVAAHP